MVHKSILYMKTNKITTIIVAVLLFSALFLSCDNTQIKQIGDTHFYLMENDQGNGSLLYHNEGSKHPFYPITHTQEGVVDDVYWNKQYIIVKCSQPESDTIQYWYDWGSKGFGWENTYFFKKINELIINMDDVSNQKK